MTKPMVRFVDLDTDEVIDREMTNAEFTAYKKNEEALALAKTEVEAKATAKTALLERLGLTEDEAKLLLS